MKTPRLLSLAFASWALLALSNPYLASAAPAKADATYIQKVADGETPPAGMPEKSGKTGWWARSWNKTDGASFFGKPVPMTATENTDENIDRAEQLRSWHRVKNSG